METEIAILNGEIIPAAELHVRPQDMGFMLGVTVAEQLRTFHGELFEVAAHKQRLARSLEILGVEVDLDDLLQAGQRVVEHNFKLVNPRLDLGLTLFVTPGLYPTYRATGDDGPTIGVHSYPLPFALWREKYEHGQACEIVDVPQVSQACWPRELKCRSRMHYYLADKQASQRNADARAILLDDDGCINEASTANVVAYFSDEGLVSPQCEHILPGISLGFVKQLARRLEIPFSYRPLTPEELLSADEVLFTSTPYCLLPVSRVGERVYTGRTCFRNLLNAWNNSVGLNIEVQAKVSVEVDGC